ncbi:MAG: hypothetical protein RMK29_16845 [Myxococcales bacterium]|nr:hypothetical protein [Myxococcota bacterium]MDW8283377.1 hypothetical protein [Myxococcales bacterium]
MSPGEGTALRCPLRASGRHLVPIAVAVGVLLGLWAASPAIQAAFVGGAALLGGLELVLRRRQPVLIVDDQGYRVEVGGRLRLTVRWDEVRRVRYERSERALYVDCGDPARNLLVPPERGYAFTFANRERLVDAILAAVPTRVEEVTDLAGQGQQKILR